MMNGSYQRSKIYNPIYGLLEPLSVASRLQAVFPICFCEIPFEPTSVYEIPSRIH
jgi:hypothetical protein